MRLDVWRGIARAPRAQGEVVAIDVLRAFTTAAFALAAGAREILLVAEPDEAFRLRERIPGVLLAGEIGGRPIPGFDFGNSPAAMERASLEGRTLVLRTSSGTQGVVRARAAKRIWLGSLVVASATARALRDAPRVTLLALGSTQGPDGPEDEACARVLADLLSGKVPDLEAAKLTVWESPGGRHALDSTIDWISPEDLECATAIDRFDFAMPVSREGDLLIARAERGR